MKIYRSISLLLLVSFINAIIPIGILSASAQDVITLGEIRTTGKVYIGSSEGKWQPAGQSYPLIQSTAVRTEDGSATVYFRDGSRAAVSKGTTAVIGGTPSDYSINLSKGVLVFNIAPSASLSVETASAVISVNNKNGLVQKVSFEKEGNVSGVITVSDKGTDIRSISGKMAVSVGTSGAKIIASGESMFAGPDNKYKIFKTQAIIDGGNADESEDRSGPYLYPFLIGGALIGAGIYIKSLTHASPSRP